MALNETKTLQMTSKKPLPSKPKKNKLKGGSNASSIEINDKYLDENLQ